MREVSGLTFGRGIACIRNIYAVFFSSSRQMQGYFEYAMTVAFHIHSSLSLASDPAFDAMS